MFYVYNLKNDINNISIRGNYSITNCHAMFYGLTNITFLDLSKFDTSEAIDMSCMFCSLSLKSINLNHFNTLKVNNVGSIFYKCNELTSLNLNSFNTSSLYIMAYMLYNCFNLKKLNIYNFDTTSVTYCDSMFYNVTKLIYCFKNENNISNIQNLIPVNSIINCKEIFFENYPSNLINNNNIYVNFSINYSSTISTKEELTDKITEIKETYISETINLEELNNTITEIKETYISEILINSEVLNNTITEKI